MGRSIYISIPLMFLLAVLQTAVFPFLLNYSLTPILPFVVALAWALIYRPEDGLVWAFAGGFFLDLFSTQLLGINALAFVLALAAVLLIESTLPNGRYLTMLILSSLGTLIYILLYSLLLRTWGTPVSFSLVLTLLPLILLHAILGLPIYWLLERIDRLIRPPRIRAIK